MDEQEEGGKEGEKNALLPHLLGKYLHFKYKSEQKQTVFHSWKRSDLILVIVANQSVTPSYTIKASPNKRPTL